MISLSLHGILGPFSLNTLFAGSMGKSFKKNISNKDALRQDTEDPHLFKPQNNSGCTLSPSEEEKLTANKKKQKLHWGYVRMIFSVLFHMH